MADTRLGNALELKGGVNGLKFILGAAMVVLAHQLAAVKELAPMFPNNENLAQIGTVVESARSVLEKLMLVAGNGTMAYGLWDKIKKFFTFKKG